MLRQKDSPKKKVSNFSRCNLRIYRFVNKKVLEFLLVTDCSYKKIAIHKLLFQLLLLEEIVD